MNGFAPRKGRVILHVDMNSFFASVEAAYDPSLKGKPLAVAGNEKERKGIIVTCSYEARKYGIKTTMPLWEAKKLCPQLIVRKPDHEKYRRVSEAMFHELRQFSELVEPVSIDEGYIDVTDCEGWGSPVDLAADIQRRLLDQLDLPCSIGIAPSKFLAKMASDMKKPMGITVLRKRDIQHRIWPLPIIEMHGIGEKTAERLQQLGIFTIGELARFPDLQIKAALGIRGQKLRERANGIDARPVDPMAADDYKSAGQSLTLPRDVSNQTELLAILKNLAEGTSVRLRRRGYVTSNISVMIRYKNRKTITRSKKLSNPIVDPEHIFEAAKHLFLAHWDGNPVRLLGVTGQDLIAEESAVLQLDLFTFQQEAKKEPLYAAIEQIQGKYGKAAVQKGISRQKRKG